MTGTISSIACPAPRQGTGRKRINDGYLKQLFDSISDTVVALDTAGRILFASASCQSLFGIKEVRLIGRAIYDHVHGNDVESVKAALAMTHESDTARTCEFRMRHANGNILWVEMHSHRLTDRGRDEVVALLRDISARHRNAVQEDELKHHLEEQVEERNQELERTIELLTKQNNEHKLDKEALELSEMRYTALVENTLTGIYIHDGNKMIFCNERFAQIFGFDRDSLESMNTDDLFAGSRSIETLLSDMSKQELVKGMTCTGKPIWLKLSRTRLVCNSHSMVIGNVIDVTEQVASNERLVASELELHTLSAQLMAAQESERKRIANELHDGLGQRLSAIKFAVENVWRVTDKEMFPDQSRTLATVIETIRDSIEEVRRVSMDLRPSILDDLGLIATIGWFTREFSALFPNIGVHRNISAAETDIPEDVKVVVFRIVQEAFHNIAKHAQADQVVLELSSYNNNLHLMISDNGCGISTIDHSPCAKGLGLKSMRERAELTHGDFRIDSVAGKGTTISVQWPQTLN